jgi:hypothetical protein
VNRPSPGKACLGLGVIGGILAFSASMLTIILFFGIWPGEAKLTASLFCPADHPDAFVVTDTYSAQPGETSTTFSLYCMGPRGEVKDVGIGGTFFVLTLGHAVLIVAAAVLGIVLFRQRRTRRASAAPARS